MSRHLSFTTLALALLPLGGCSTKAAPTPDRAGDATPAPLAIAATSATAAVSGSVGVTPRTSVTQHEVTPAVKRGEVSIGYVQVTHPNVGAAAEVNRALKAEADKLAKASAAHLQSETPAEVASWLSPERKVVECRGGFVGEELLGVVCDGNSYLASFAHRNYPVYGSVWSFASGKAVRLSLSGEIGPAGLGAVHAACAHAVEDGDEPVVWEPKAESLELVFPTLTPTVAEQGAPRCSLHWDVVERFLRADSPLRAIAAKAPRSPAPPPLESLPLPAPPADPGRRAEGLPAPLEGHGSACQGGDQRACVRVAEALYNGKVVRVDEALGAWLFWKACEAGEPTGCVNLGWVMLEGKERPGMAAAPYFGRACSGAVTVGCLGLGTIYRDGRDTPRDPARAAELFQKACDGGVKAGCAMAKAGRPKP